MYLLLGQRKRLSKCSTEKTLFTFCFFCSKIVNLKASLARAPDSRSFSRTFSNIHHAPISLLLSLRRAGERKTLFIHLFQCFNTLALGNFVCFNNNVRKIALRLALLHLLALKFLRHGFRKFLRGQLV